MPPGRGLISAFPADRAVSVLQWNPVLGMALLEALIPAANWHGPSSCAGSSELGNNIQAIGAVIKPEFSPPGQHQNPIWCHSSGGREQLCGC